MRETLLFGDSAKELRLISYLPSDLLARLDERGVRLPAMPELSRALERLGPVAQTARDSPRGLVDAMMGLYPTLTKWEGMLAIRKLCAEAYVADERNAPEVTEAFEEMFARYREVAENPVARPRVIVARSDLPFAQGGVLPGAKEGSLIISSRAAEILDKEQLKAVLAHELGHIDKHFKPGRVHPMLRNIVAQVVTRGASSRRNEYEADALARAVVGREPLTAGLRIMYDDMVETARPMEKLRNEMVDFAGEYPRIPRPLRWLLARYTPEISVDKMLEEVEPGRLQTLLKAPSHPTIARRDARMREDEARGR